MAGHVFHPGHDELHGVTVVLDLRDGRTVIGRYHDTEDGKLRLHDVAVHRAGENGSREEFLARTLKFGVRSDTKFMAVPESEVQRMTPLNALTA